MTDPRLVVIGAGGHAKVVIELLRANGREPVACISDAESTLVTCLGVPVLAGDHHLSLLRADGVAEAVVAIGSNNARAALARRAAELGFALPAVTSPRATISPTATIGAGTVVMAGATINAEATVGELVIVNTNASVDHDCVIGDAVHIAPNSALAGNVTIGDRVLVGAGSTIIPGCTVGRAATVGAGAVVLTDVGDDETVVGVPSRRIAR